MHQKIENDDLLTPFVDTVLWAVTTNCNLRCTYCAVSIPTYKGHDFDLSSVDRVAEEFASASVRLVQISGHGETTIIPNWHVIAHEFSSRGIAVCITSNFGKAFSDEEIDALARMDFINISIDTIDRDLLRDLRRKVDIRTILHNMALVRLRALRLGKEAKFNWQCTLSDVVIDDLSDWMQMGLLNGVTIFTLGNLIEHHELPDTPRHPAKLDEAGLNKTCRTLQSLAEVAARSGAQLVIQPGIIEGLNESLAKYGHNEPFSIVLPSKPSTIVEQQPKSRRLFNRIVGSPK